jgi:hypothetical protein
VAVKTSRRAKIALTAVLSLLASALPFGHGLAPAFAAPSGTLTIDDSGGVYEITSNLTVPSADIESALVSGNVVLHATEITVASDIDAPNTNSLTLKSTGSIVVNGAVDITSQGGDLLFWADSNASAGGNIRLGRVSDPTRGTIVSNGGDIRFGGGADFATGYAMGTNVTLDSKPLFGIASWGFYINAGGGDISMRAQLGVNGSARAILFETANLGAISNELVTSGAGTISLLGDASTISGALSGNQWGVQFEGAFTTASGDVSIIGLGGNGASNAIGILTAGTVSITSTSGDINFEDRTVTTPNAGFLFQGGNHVLSTSGDITIQADKFRNGSTTLAITANDFSITPFTDESFDADVNVGPIDGTNAASVTIGEASNSANMTLNGAVTSGGTLAIHGANVALNAASSADTANIYSSGNVTQTAAATIPSLAMHGSGSYALTNTLNAFGTISAGSGGTKVGTLSVYDSSGGLTIGQVGSLEGITATGDVLVETGEGDITVAKSVATDSTSSTAITFNAGKSTAAGTETGGNIVISGSPTLTSGTGGIARLFSGSESDSTGLTALAGGASNTYFGVDENSTLSPALSSGTSYALYRATASATSSSGESSSSSSSSVTPATPAPVAPGATPRPTRLPQTGPNTAPVMRPVERLGLVFDPDVASRATVGGAIANLSQFLDGPSALSLAAGSFEFGVRLNEGSGAEVQTDTPSRSPELFLPRGDAAEVSGKGSYPGSFVQVWLPGEGNDSLELARIPVRPDGTFASSFSFEAGGSDLPVRIGRQVLQVVSYDEQGNQTVVDMTINIGQGVPAPELNRQLGALPDLGAGESLATSGGIPESVSIAGVPEAGRVVVEGNAWVIGVNADSDNGSVENTDGGVLMRLYPSSVGQWSGSGFMPGTLATVWLFSEPTLMTTVTIDENGEFSSEFLVDGRLIAPGEHTLQVQGVGADGYIKAANLGVLVEQPVELTTESSLGLLWWVAGGFLLLLLVLVFVIAARRRRA